MATTRTPRTIFNPLASGKPSESSIVTAASAQPEVSRLTSTSSIHNNDVGVCPKCKKAMGKATIAGGDQVFYCTADRVSAPMPDSEYTRTAPADSL